MPVDRGGLQYPIEVIDEFSDPLALFRAELGQAELAWAEFRKTLNDGPKIDINVSQQVAAIQKLQNTQAAVDARLDAQRAAAAAKLQAQQASAGAALSAQQQAAAQRLIIIQTTGQARINAAQAQANAVQQIAAQRVQAAQNNAAGAALRLAQAQARVAAQQTGQPGVFQRIQNSLQGVNSEAETSNNLFERLFARVLIVAAIRKVAEEFGNFVGKIIDFNSQVETATLGIATLFLALGGIKDASGEATTSTQQFALAQAEARKQVAALRIEALRTTGTFEELVKTFQVAVAPGLQAGLSVDQIRKLTVQISQAAAAIGVPQNQLAEEIRSLLSGTINTRNTRIATALGITNDDIKNAKEQANLIGLLQQKFQAFNTTSQAALGTFSVILSNLNDAIFQIIGTGGKEFFDTLKAAFKDLQNSLVSLDVHKDALTLNPKAIALVKIITDALTTAVNEARTLASLFGFEGLLPVVQALGAAFNFVVQALSGFISGALAGFGDLAVIFKTVLNAVQSILGIDLTKSFNVKDVVAGVTRILVVLFGINSANKLIALSFSPILAIVNQLAISLSTVVGIVNVLFAAVSALAGLASFLGAPVVLAIAGIVALGFGLKALLDAITGVDLKFTSFIEILGRLASLGLGTLLRSASLVWGLFVDEATFAFKAVKDFAFTTIDAILLFVSERIKDAIGSIADSLRNSLGFGNIVAGLDKTISAIDVIQSKIKGAANDRTNDLDKSFKAVGENADATLKRILLGIKIESDAIDTIIKNNDKAPSIADLLGRGLTLLTDKIKGLFSSIVPSAENLNLGQFNDAVKQTAQSTDDLSKRVEGLSGIFSTSATKSAEEIKKLAGLQDQLFKSQNDLNRATDESLSLTGAVSNQYKIQTEALQKIHELTKDEVTTARTIREGLDGIAAQRLATEQKINDLDVGQQTIVNQTTLLVQRSLDLRNQIAHATDDHNLSLLDNLKTQLQINDAELDALKNKNQSGLTDEENQKTANLAFLRIQLEATEKVLLDDLNVIEQKRVATAKAVNAEAAVRVALSARQNAVELERANEIAAVQQKSAAATFAARDAFNTAQSLVEAQNALNLLTAQVEQARILRDITIVQVQAQILGETSAERRIDLQRQLNALMDQDKIKTADENIQLVKSAEALERAKSAIETPLRSGFFDGLKKAAQELPSVYQGTIDLVKSAITGLSEFISTSIVDAFDPSKDSTILERFSQFLQSIAKQVLQMFIQLAIVRSLLGLGFLSSGGVPGGGLPGLSSLGFHDGGKIPARGYAAGGRIRPAGIHPADTTPIWAQPGEFMQRVAAVQTYGADFMDRINRCLIDPYALRAIAGLGGATQMRTSPISNKRSFASGGVIPSASAAQAGTGSNASAAQIPISVVVANDDNVSRLLAGGRNAVIDFMQQNRGKLKAIFQ